MLILIPSRSRWDRIGRGPLRQLPRAVLKGQTIVAVPESQKDQYTWALQNFDQSARPVLETVPDDWRIGRKRRHLGEMAERLGFSTFFFLDDDIGFLVRKSAATWQLREAGVLDVEQMLKTVGDFLDSSTFSHIGISAREGNNRIGEGDELKLIDVNTRLMRAVAWRTAAYLETDPTRVEGIEDFDTSLQSLRAGYENVCLYYWAQGQRETGETGGCADWRTLEVHEANVRKLAELHAPFVKIRQKKNKTGGLAERLETHIMWKQAAAEGRAKRG